MPGTTATQKLTYPVNTDLLKDQWSYQRTLAQQVEGRFVNHYYDLGRSQVPPLAVVDLTIPASYPVQGSFTPGNELLDFDTVQVDTANLVDLSANPNVINLTTPGYWSVGGYAFEIGTTCSAGSVILYVSGTGFTGQNFQNSARDVGVAGFNAQAVSYDVQITSTGTVFAYIGINGTCNNTTSVQNARMWAYWVRDL